MKISQNPLHLTGKKQNIRNLRCFGVDIYTTEEVLQRFLHIIILCISIFLGLSTIACVEIVNLETPQNPVWSSRYEGQDWLPRRAGTTLKRSGTSNLELKAESITSSAEIRYTTDGSRPTATSPILDPSKPIVHSSDGSGETTYIAIAKLGTKLSEPVQLIIQEKPAITGIPIWHQREVGSSDEFQPIPLPSTMRITYKEYRELIAPSTTPGATVRYEYASPAMVPQETSPVVSESSPIQTHTEGEGTYTARAFHSSRPPSDSTTIIITIDSGAVNPPSISPVPGEYATFPTITITPDENDETIYYTFTVDGSTPSDPSDPANDPSDPANPDPQSRREYTSPITVPDNVHTYRIRAVAKNDNDGVYSTVIEGTYLVPGAPQITIGGTPATTVSCNADDSSGSFPSIAVPVSQEITIADPSGSRVVYYTTSTDSTEPSDPDTSSTRANGTPFTILNTPGTTYKVKAVTYLGEHKSAIVCLRYDRPALPLSAPTFNIPGGVQTMEQMLTITAAAPTEGTSSGTAPAIYYTFSTDGSEPADPTADSTLYDGSAITILRQAGTQYAIKAIAVLSDYANSEIARSSYSRHPALASPTFDIPGGEQREEQMLTITATASTAGPSPGTTPAIYYTFSTDGSEPADPTASSTRYDGNAITILSTLNSDYRIKAISILDGYENSPLVMERFTLSDSDNDSIANLLDNCPTMSNTDQSDSDSDNAGNVCDVDDDNDGLIEITGATMAEQLTMLHNIRYNLLGTSYDTDQEDSTGRAGSTLGAPTMATPNCSTGTDVDGDTNTPLTYLCGYELTGNLDFDTGSNGTWTESAGVYTLDVDDNVSPYFVTAEGGWTPIGSTTNSFFTTAAFNAIFEGNGHTIHNLAIQLNETYIGLFGATAENAQIRNVGIEDSLVEYKGSPRAQLGMAALVGVQIGGSIANSYSTNGIINGGDHLSTIIASLDSVGGLVGRVNSRGRIIDSYASEATLDGKDGSTDRVGGLVGYISDGDIVASYATGTATGGSGDNDQVGGLVGSVDRGRIVASYATVATDGGAGSFDRVGGLIGYQTGGSVTASYSTGSADGGAGSTDYVGGLIGVQTGGQVTASYSSGNANGGDDGGDVVGSFIGWQENGLTTPVTASYGFGTVTGAETTSGTVGGGTAGIAGTNKPAGVTTPAGLTEANAGSQWNAAAIASAGAWDFTTKTRAELGGGPSIRYADYDGTDSTNGTTYHCDNARAGATTSIEVPCTTGLIPGQQ